MFICFKVKNYRILCNILRLLLKLTVGNTLRRSKVYGKLFKRKGSNLKKFSYIETAIAIFNAK